jgi:ribose transport system permease protein
VVARYPTVVLLILLCVVFSLTTSVFLTSENLTTVLATNSVIAIVTFAALIPLIVGEFDLSLGYMVGFTQMVGAYLAGKGWGLAPMLLAMVLGGCLAGLVNGVLTVRFKISAFVATLGVGIILSAFTAAISDGKILYQGVPHSLTSFGRDKVIGIPISVLFVAVIAILLVYLLDHTPMGRRWYATGGSERVAFLAGVPTGNLKILAFISAGALASLAAVVSLAQSGSAGPTAGVELLLPAYAGAFLSVVAYRLGFFNVPGAVIAVLVLAVGFNGLSLLGVPFWGQPLFNGVVLLLAVLTARTEARRVMIG